MKNVTILVLAIFSILYLINPGAGIFEMIPDNLPFVGNLDEAAAMALLLMCLKYFGLDLPNIFRRDPGDKLSNKP